MNKQEDMEGREERRVEEMDGQMRSDGQKLMPWMYYKNQTLDWYNSVATIFFFLFFLLTPGLVWTKWQPEVCLNVCMQL